MSDRTSILGVELACDKEGTKRVLENACQCPRERRYPTWKTMLTIPILTKPWRVLSGIGLENGLVGGPGDRRDEDFVTLGKLSAQMFDRIIVKEDDDTRGRPRGDAADLISEGIEATESDCRYETILDEAEAIETALDMASKDSLVVVLPEIVSRAIRLIEVRQPQVWLAPRCAIGINLRDRIRNNLQTGLLLYKRNPVF